MKKAIVKRPTKGKGSSKLGDKKKAIIKYFNNENIMAQKAPEFKSNTITISGLSYKYSKQLVNVISITLGIIIFLLIPYVANNIKKPMTSAILLAVPNGMVLAFFIVESKFMAYFTGLIFAPLINPILNESANYLYETLHFPAGVALAINIGVWLLMVIIAFVLNL
jgi:hypothetical protein